MNSRLQHIYWWIEYVAIRALSTGMHIFPINANLHTARLIARTWWHILPKHRRRAMEHLRAAFGQDMDEQELQRIAFASFQSIIMTVVELLCVHRFMDRWNWHHYLKPIDLEEAFEWLINSRGAILVTGHYGNWELTGYLMAMMGIDVTAVMRPLDNPYLNDFLVETRRRRGLELLAKKGATASVEEVIRRGGAIGFIADQNAGRKGIFVDFFGRPASTYKSIGLLAMSLEVPIICGYARRLGNQFQYEISANRIIYPHEWKDRDDPLRWITEEYTAAIEEFVREVPEQYLWIHRRWKTRPKGEKPKDAKSGDEKEAA